MSKVNFSKVESALSDTLKKIYIDQLADLSVLATLVNTPLLSLPQTKIDEVLHKLRGEILNLKKHNSKLYKKLNISSKEEKLIFTTKPLKSKDWSQLSNLKNRIEELKKELYGETIDDPEIERQIEIERKKHINKRFNVRENWLPLH